MATFTTTRSIWKLIFIFLLKFLVSVLRIVVFVPGFLWVAGNELRKIVYKKYP